MKYEKINYFILNVALKHGRYKLSKNKTVRILQYCIFALRYKQTFNPIEWFSQKTHEFFRIIFCLLVIIKSLPL